MSPILSKTGCLAVIYEKLLQTDIFSAYETQLSMRFIFSAQIYMRNLYTRKRQQYLVKRVWYCLKKCIATLNMVTNLYFQIYKFYHNISLRKASTRVLLQYLKLFCSLKCTRVMSTPTIRTRSTYTSLGCFERLTVHMVCYIYKLLKP